MKAPPAASVFDPAYHYPPELFELLVEAVPALYKSKPAVLDFFRGCGAPDGLLSGWRQRIATEPLLVKKAAIAREVLRALNEGGDTLLAQRREVIKRVSECEDFSSCWDNDRLKAEASVYKVREIVNRRDSFTRMNIEREHECLQRQRAQQEAIAAKQKALAERSLVKHDLYALFTESDHHKRGKALESVLNRLFASYGMLVREAFTVKGEPGQGVVEQIDGAVEIDGDLYLVELKWWKEPISRAELGPHLVSVYSRADGRGIFISCSGFTESAISDAKNALTQRIYVLTELEEIVRLLDQEGDLKGMFLEKIRAAKMDRLPLFRHLNRDRG